MTFLIGKMLIVAYHLRNYVIMVSVHVKKKAKIFSFSRYTVYGHMIVIIVR